MSAAQELLIGTIGKPWGIKGQFLVDPRGSDPARLVSRGRLRVRIPGSPDREHAIVSSHFAGGRLVVQIEGCRTPEEAERLRGAEIIFPAEDLSPAPDGSYYPHQLVDMPLVTRDGREIGTVQRVVETAGPDLLEVRSGAREILIPFVEAICRVDAEAGTIEIDPPDGLLELD